MTLIWPKYKIKKKLKPTWRQQRTSMKKLNAVISHHHVIIDYFLAQFVFFHFAFVIWRCFAPFEFVTMSLWTKLTDFRRSGMITWSFESILCNHGVIALPVSSDCLIFHVIWCNFFVISEVACNCILSDKKTTNKFEHVTQMFEAIDLQVRNH